MGQMAHGPTSRQKSSKSVQIDIPRIVAETDGAPYGVEEFNGAVHAELMAYWADRLASLPTKSTPGWLPLP